MTFFWKYFSILLSLLLMYQICKFMVHTIAGIASRLWRRESELWRIKCSWKFIISWTMHGLGLPKYAVRPSFVTSNFLHEAPHLSYEAWSCGTEGFNFGPFTLVHFFQDMTQLPVRQNQLYAWPFCPYILCMFSK